MGEIVKRCAEELFLATTDPDDSSIAMSFGEDTFREILEPFFAEKFKGNIRKCGQELERLVENKYVHIERILNLYFAVSGNNPECKWEDHDFDRKEETIFVQCKKCDNKYEMTQIDSGNNEEIDLGADSYVEAEPFDMDRAKKFQKKIEDVRKSSNKGKPKLEQIDDITISEQESKIAELEELLRQRTLSLEDRNNVLTDLVDYKKKTDARIKELEGVLRSVEWANKADIVVVEEETKSVLYCPLCGINKEYGHKLTCKIGSVLTDKAALKDKEGNRE